MILKIALIANIVLVILKVTETVTWSWWVIMSPIIAICSLQLLSSTMILIGRLLENPTQRAIRDYYKALTGKKLR